MRVLAVADSDSYLKWSAATLAELPGTWSKRLVIIDSPVRPSPAQQAAAGGSDGPVRSLAGLVAEVRRLDPDVILLGCTGPVVELLAALPVIGAAHRTLVTGLPGLSIPVSARALDYRRGCDVFVVASRRERRDFAALAASRAPSLRLALARLPFLRADQGGRGAGSAVVFAAQAKVPADIHQRREILRALAELPAPLHPVVKLRAAAGERQTHDERHPYPQLWRSMVSTEGVRADAVTFRYGSMTEALREAAGLVTVSSTAALEAMVAGVGVIVLSDFGVTAQQLNLVFADSGCLGTLADVRAGHFRTPDPDWLLDNYGHPATEDDLTAVIAEVAAARIRQPSARRVRPRPRRLVRSAARLLAPRFIPTPHP